MTPKERAAMQQVICKINQVTAFDETGDELLFEAQEILRKALEHSGEADEMVAMNLNCKSVQARLATSWGYVKAEQPEQGPVAWAHPSGGHLSARYMKEFATGLEKETHTIPLYAAPFNCKGKCCE